MPTMPVIAVEGPSFSGCRALCGEMARALSANKINSHIISPRIHDNLLEEILYSLGLDRTEQSKENFLDHTVEKFTLSLLSKMLISKEIKEAERSNLLVLLETWTLRNDIYQILMQPILSWQFQLHAIMHSMHPFIARPDIVILLDIDENTFHQRFDSALSTSVMDRFCSQNFDAIRQCYLQQMNVIEFKNRARVPKFMYDGALPLDELLAKVWLDLLPILNERGLCVP